MSPLQTVLAVLIATGIPAVFLLIIYTLDLYASRTFRLVLIAFAWGGIGGLALAYVFNTYVALPIIYDLRLDLIWLYVAFAPFAEEILKSLSLLYISKQPQFTYFVDGAIYGFAAGIGFSITENYLYMSFYPGQGVGVFLIRAFSTCLMHGTAAALVGAAVGRSRFKKQSGQWMALVGGWFAAILLHALFNSVSKTGLFSDALVLILVVAIGLAGVGLIAFFIMLGLREQRQWMAETLDRKLGVSGAESRAVQSYGTIDELLEPVFEQFPEQAEQIEDLLLSQAQMGIKRKVQQNVEDPRLKEKIGEEIDALHAKMEELRKEIGPYAMSYVRMVFPEGVLDIFSRLLERVEGLGSDEARWVQMVPDVKEPPTSTPDQPVSPSIYDKLRERDKSGPEN